MADGKELTAEQLAAKELTDLVAKFQGIADATEKARFYHATPALHAIFRAVHFPKADVASSKSEP